MSQPRKRTAHRSHQGVFSHRCLRKASAADLVVIGPAGLAGIVANIIRLTFNVIFGFARFDQALNYEILSEVVVKRSNIGTIHYWKNDHLFFILYSNKIH